jgi:phenylacetate-CoA ligase
VDDATTLSDALARLPIISRQHVHHAGEALKAERLLPGEVFAGTVTSSGASGPTVHVAITALGRKWQRILDLRGLLWAAVDFNQSIAAIQNLPPGMADYPSGLRNERWKDASEIPFRTGPSFHLSAGASLGEQWAWLKRVAPTYLQTSPSCIREYAKFARDAELAFEKILTSGDIVDAELRALAATRFKAEIHDTYASQETGCLAIQCPDTNTYHVQSEAIIVEVLDDEGRPCKEGEIGRVVATPLFNLASPLIRYEIGDVAEAGGMCECGRSLPMLKRIAGTG